MKKFNEWIQERHPESFQEFNLAQGARNFANKVGRGINKTRVGMKRAGQLIDKATGADPYERQKANRKNHQDKEALLRDLQIEESEERKLPHARDTLLAELKANFPTAFLKTSEEFSPNRQGGIWITGKEMADYYGKDNSGYDYYVNPKLQKILNKHGFYLEPLDPETWFAWPI